jgi:pyrroloquinoline quinone biosynthesis protein B
LRPLQTHSRDLGINGIFLTHGHIGHYLGLVQLGKEVCDARTIPIFATKKMIKFINANKLLKTLIHNRNIRTVAIEHGKGINIDDNLTITPILVHHRLDFTDTVGYFISGPNKHILYAPDMDSITKPVLEFVRRADIVFIDGTFYQNDELLPRRDIRSISHTPILESMKVLSPYVKNTRIFFIHFNNTNPFIQSDSTEANYVKGMGFNLTPERWNISI